MHGSMEGKKQQSLHCGGVELGSWEGVLVPFPRCELGDAGRRPTPFLSPVQPYPRSSASVSEMSVDTVQMDSI